MHIHERKKEKGRGTTRSSKPGARNVSMKPEQLRVGFVKAKVTVGIDGS
jgi:hypothetical protein